MAPVSIREGKIPEQKQIENGRLFPKVVIPAAADQYHNSDSQNEEMAAVLEFIRKEKDWIQHELQESGALLFRGFKSMRTASDFNSFVDAFGWEEHTYQGFAPRNNVVGRVWTANEAPLDQEIFFHHEMALVKDFPSKLFFFCEIAPPEGGQTAIVRSDRVACEMESKFPSLVQKLEREGILTCTPLPKEENRDYFLGKSWQSHLQTNDPEEAQRRVEAGGSKLVWMEDGSANITAGPLPATRTFEGYGDRKVWFNYIPAAVYKKAENYNILLCGDGSAIPRDIIEESARVMNNECVEVKWEAGDVLLIDNLAVMHARRPSKPPRRVLVSMCK